MDSLFDLPDFASGAPLEPLADETTVILTDDIITPREDPVEPPAGIADCSECDDHFYTQDSADDTFLNKTTTDYLAAGVGPTSDGSGSVGFGNRKFYSVSTITTWSDQMVLQGGAFEVRNSAGTKKMDFGTAYFNGVDSSILRVGTSAGAGDGHLAVTGESYFYGLVECSDDVNVAGNIDVVGESNLQGPVWGVETYIKDSSISNDYVGEAFSSYTYDRLDYIDQSFTRAAYTKDFSTKNFWADDLKAAVLGFITARSEKTHIAEYYIADRDYPEGTVVCFGGDKEVTSEATVGTFRVAGVVVPVNEQALGDLDDLDDLDNLDGQFDDLASMKDEIEFSEIRTFKSRLEELRALTQLDSLKALDILKDYPADEIADNPALLLGSKLKEASAEPVVAVSLKGRTKCIVTGKVYKGDILIANGKGGAMSATIPEEAGPNIYAGSIIGKALEDSLTDLNAIIDIVVT